MSQTGETEAPVLIKGKQAVTVLHGRRRALAVVWDGKPWPGDPTVTIKRYVPFRNARGPVMGHWAKPEKVPTGSVVFLVGPVDHTHLTDARFSAGWA